MTLNRGGRLFAIGMLVAFLLFGCAGARPARAAQAEKKDTPPVKPTELSAPAAPVHPAPSPTDDTKLEGDKLSLTGIVMTVPAGWTSEPAPAPGPMAPKAVLKIGNNKGDPAVVRVTYFPGMKGKDDMNIDRWLGQVAQPDGKPYTRENSKIDVSEANGVKLTMVDLSGTVKPTMRDTAKEGWRMIAAIVDHPKGPHFVVAAGPADAIARSKEQVIAFIKSAKPN